MADINKFRHKTTINVRFNEVDMLGVCNNTVYHVYLDEARLKYIKESGLRPVNGWFSDGRLFFVVRNEINYLDFARFDDELNIYTRIEYIKKSSIGFEHIVENAKTKKIIAEGKGVLVHVDPITRKSSPIPENYIAIVREYEKEVEIKRG
jgi:acyl-CoA thioester hydrolase